MKINFEKQNNEENFLTHSVDHFSEMKKIAEEELGNLLQPIDALSRKLDSVTNYEEWATITKEIGNLHGMGEGSLGESINRLKDKIRHLNTQIILRTRKDLVEQYLVIRSSIEDAYTILAEISNDDDSQKIENLIHELEEGLESTRKDMSAEGVSMKDVEGYSQQYDTTEI